MCYPYAGVGAPFGEWCALFLHTFFLLYIDNKKTRGFAPGFLGKTIFTPSLSFLVLGVPRPY